MLRKSFWSISSALALNVTWKCLGHLWQSSKEKQRRAVLLSWLFGCYQQCSNKQTKNPVFEFVIVLLNCCLVVIWP